jgi:valyl-tRNA synthetase
MPSKKTVPKTKGGVFGIGKKSILTSLTPEQKQFLDDLNVDEGMLIKDYKSHLSKEDAENEIRHLLALAHAKTKDLDLTLKSSRNDLSKDLNKAFSLYQSRSEKPKELANLQKHMMQTLDTIRESSTRNVLEKGASKLKSKQETMQFLAKTNAFVKSAKEEQAKALKEQLQTLEARILALKLPSPPKSVGESSQRGGKTRTKKAQKVSA